MPERLEGEVGKAVFAEVENLEVRKSREQLLEDGEGGVLEAVVLEVELVDLGGEREIFWLVVIEYFFVFKLIINTESITSLPKASTYNYSRTN